MDKRINLWNLSSGKSRKVVEYISSLYPPHSAMSNQIDYFYEVVDLALSKPTANEMLETIGYNPKGRDKIFIDCLKK